MLPSGVAVPADETDLIDLLKWAAASGKSPHRRQALVLRGAGSAMGGGNVGDGLVVDLTGMPKGLTIDAASRKAVTSASVTLGEIAQAAERHGLRLPPDPSSARWATVGGIFSTNASGPRTLRYGSVRRWALGATIVTPDGERLQLRRGEPAASGATTRRFAADVAPLVEAAAPAIRERFPHTRKNSSGYALDAWLDSGDLLDLFIGAEGTPGVVTEVTWPRPDPGVLLRDASGDSHPDPDRGPDRRSSRRGHRFASCSTAASSSCGAGPPGRTWRCPMWMLQAFLSTRKIRRRHSRQPSPG
jgi:D-lactate dehydrogenase (cytochrome)